MNQPTKLEKRQTASLIPYARNARTHSEAQVAQIAASIKEFGFNAPVLIDKDNGIIAGHGRVLAAQKLGLESVPCLVLGHLTENQKRAYILADNKLALNAGWDEEMLKLELSELVTIGNIDLSGFSCEDAGAFDVSETTAPTIPDGDRAPFRQMTFTLHDEQAEVVDAAIKFAKEQGHGESETNENSNGNALAWIAEVFNRGEC